MEEGIARAEGSKPIFIYFAPEEQANLKELPTHLSYSKAVEKLSERSAAFVLLAIPKKDRTDEQTAVLKKYNIRKIPSCVVADPYGRRLVGASHAGTEEWISKKVGAAQKLIKKTNTKLKDCLRKGKAALKKDDLNMAVFHFAQIAGRYPGYPAHEEAVQLLAETKEKIKARNAPEKKDPEPEEKAPEPEPKKK